MSDDKLFISPENVVEFFLKTARERAFSVFLVYGYNSDGRAIIKSAANVPPAAAEGLRRTMLGIDEVGMLAAAQALHNDIGGCDVCPPRNENEPWDKLTEAELQSHLRVVRIVFDSLKNRSTAKVRES